MKKDIILKRIFCFALILLGLFGLWNDFQDLLGGKGADTGSLLSLLGIAVAGYLFIHPEKLEWNDVGTAWRIWLGVFMSLVGGGICVAYLFFGLKFGYPENWKLICGVSAIVAVVGVFILFPEKLKKGRKQ